jgi:glutathione peroxidase-family protein
LSLYGKYKEKGLEIVGVSDDDSALDAWRTAVAKDQIGVWRHVLRGLKRTATGFDKSTDISGPYGIHSLPTKILIDKEGMIIGRYGGGGEGDDAMDKKLAELFEN